MLQSTIRDNQVKTHFIGDDNLWLVDDTSIPNDPDGVIDDERDEQVFMDRDSVTLEWTVRIARWAWWNGQSEWQMITRWKTQQIRKRWYNRKKEWDERNDKKNYRHDVLDGPEKMEYSRKSKFLYTVNALWLSKVIPLHSH